MLPSQRATDMVPRSRLKLATSNPRFAMVNGNSGQTVQLTQGAEVKSLGCQTFPSGRSQNLFKSMILPSVTLIDVQFIEHRHWNSRVTFDILHSSLTLEANNELFIATFVKYV
jgi:hypothetical protein